MGDDSIPKQAGGKSGGSTRTATSARQYGQTTYDKTEQRADYVIQMRGKHPQASYAEILKMVRAKFECGIVASQQAYARAMERLRTIRDSKDGEAKSMLQAFFARVMAKAEAEGRYADAVRAGVAYGKLTCDLGSPEVVVFNGPRAEDYDDMSDEELENMARVNQAARARNAH